MRVVFNLFVFLTLCSCAGYINQIHRQIDQEEYAKYRQRQPVSQQDPNSRYRRMDQRPIQNPITLNGASTATVRNMPPETRRDYQPAGRRRYRTSDLEDNESDGSLWGGQSPDSFLFVTNNIKRIGDIVIIEVMSGFKQSITEELKRAFPAPPSNTKPGEGEATDSKSEEEENLDPSKVYDKISTNVVEVVNKDYLLLRGRKEVIFRKLKRYVEIQGVVASRDIKSNDSVSSIKLLEPKVTVLRY